MANLQNIAERIFRHVDAGHLPAGYANCMGALIDANSEDSDFHEWVGTVTASAVEKLIACMVRKGKWNDAAWLREYLQEVSKESAA
ncbi:MAG: hypothetical protein ACYCQL_09370 [Acidithiobacillus sp.]